MKFYLCHSLMDGIATREATEDDGQCNNIVLHHPDLYMERDVTPYLSLRCLFVAGAVTTPL